MKKVLFAAVCFCATLGFAQARELVRPGDAGLKREVPPKKLVPASPDRPQEPIAVYSTPFAVNFCSLSIPSAPQLDVYGMRLNITVPFATPDNQNVLGFDLGLSGEAFGHVGGVAINVFDNVSHSFSGGAVGLVNVTGELRGVQIGLVNVAKTGAGLQIGLWNQSDDFISPIIGIVW
jgi:opacity protein-like surface antigen